MTQKVRWLAALALLLVFGAGTVRAEDEDEGVRPSAPCRPAAELLPAPRIIFTVPVGPAPQRPLLFAIPTPFPCPMPTPVSVFSFCPPCATCPCPSGACPGLMCARQPQPDEVSQYVVTMKLVKGTDEETPEVTACPRVSVMEGQTATVHVNGFETSTERSSLEMQVTVTKQGKGARLEMGVEEASSHDAGEFGARSHTETTEERCNVAFDKPYKVQLKSGCDDAWLEVTVTEVEGEERMPPKACAGSCPLAEAAAATDANDGPMDAVGEVVDCLYDIVSDAATSAFAWAVESDDELEPPTPEYPVQAAHYVPPSSPLPVARVVSVEAAPACLACTAASCPKAGPGCVQCAAREAAKETETHVSIDATRDRKKVAVTDGSKHWTAEADRLTMHDDCIRLEGNVVAESCDESCHESMVIKADTILLQRKDGSLKMQLHD